MFSHIIKQALRTLSRQKVFTCINVLGLALSLACCIMLTRYLHREWTVDSNVINGETVGEIVYVDNRSYATASYIPEIKDVANDIAVESCRYCPKAQVDVKLDTVTYFANILMVDSTYLHFFDLPLIGDRQALTRPDAAYISRAMAERIFGEENPIGRSLQIFDIPMTIAGVFDYPECKQSIVTDLYVSYLLDNHMFNTGNMECRWIRLASANDKDKINNRLNELNCGNYSFINLTDSYVHYGNRSEFSMYTRDATMFAYGNANALRILGGVNILIMLIGIINFVNLYMVLMQRRKREWGVRKVYGQKSWGLLGQVWSENFLLILIAIFVAWIMVESGKGYITELMDFDFAYSWFDIQMTLAMLIVLPIIASIYPFVQYLVQPPVATIKSDASGRQGIRVRLFFLATQYLLTFCIMISAFWFNRHFNYLMEQSGILRGDHVYVVNMNHFNNNSFDENIFFKCFGVVNDIKESPLVEVCEMNGSSLPVVKNPVYATIKSNVDDKKSYVVNISFTRSTFLLFDIPLVEGDLELDREVPSDHYFFFLNETAFRELGFTSLEDAFIYNGLELHNGEEASLMGYSYSDETSNKYIQYGTHTDPVHVKGIVKDYYCAHATEGVKPMLFVCCNDENSINIGASYKIRPHEGKDQELLDYLRSVEKRYYGNEELYYHTFQDEIDELYNEDRRLTRVCSLFATIAILICCLGLLGLSLFDIRQRYREIAIRKAHGAHRKNLYLLLGKKYLYLLLFTFFLSIPVTYLLIHRYTESFIESAPLTPIIYMETLGVVALITLLTLIYQLEIAARVNVAMIVKTE